MSTRFKIFLWIICAAVGWGLFELGGFGNWSVLTSALGGIVVGILVVFLFGVAELAAVLLTLFIAMLLGVLVGTTWLIAGQLLGVLVPILCAIVIWMWDPPASKTLTR